MPQVLSIRQNRLADIGTQAVGEDRAGNHQKAAELYKLAADYVSTYLELEQNIRVRKAITIRVSCRVNRDFIRYIRSR